jgi:hypothetical protein
MLVWLWVIIMAAIFVIGAIGDIILNGNKPIQKLPENDDYPSWM